MSRMGRRSAGRLEDENEHENERENEHERSTDMTAIPMRWSQDGATPLLGYDEVPPAIAEALRGIMNRNELRTGVTLPATTAVVGAIDGDGVTTVSQALATTVALETGRFVCWVDCSWLGDTNIDGDDHRPNLIEILADYSKAESAFVSSPGLPQLVSLCPGPVPVDQRNRIVRSPGFEQLIGSLRDEFDHVIFDLPPLLAHANSLALVRLADASLFVTRHRAASVTQVRRAIESTEPTPLLGVVLNRYRSRIPSGIRRLLGE